MFRKLLVGLFTLMGGFLGVELTIYANSQGFWENVFGYKILGINFIAFCVMSGIISALINYIIFSWLVKIGTRSTKNFEKSLQTRSTSELIAGSIGLIIGLIIAFLISSGPIAMIPFAGVNTILSIVVYIVFGYLGITIAMKRKDDFINLIQKRLEKKPKDLDASKDKGKDKNKDDAKIVNVISAVQPKILDTSVIIDGRIADIVKTGFIEGPLIIPTFVLDELRHISDSSDALKRNRGRRGLDILNRIQNEAVVLVEVVERDFDDLNEVDSKLIRLAQVMNGKVMTNDYNLNKVAEIQRVPVLNINDLANAVKVVVIPGEEMFVQVIKEGKEQFQGIGYLDDGTMIVVEGGKKLIGETLNVVVTSVLQTAAGRMIFAKTKV